MNYAVKKQFKNKPICKNTMGDLKVDDCVFMKGGKCKGCNGVVEKVMKQYASVRITKDKKGVAQHGEKTTKVKREHLEIVSPPPVEMPTNDDLKFVDTLEPNKDIFQTIDEKIENKEPLTEDVKVVKVNPVATIVNENNVSRPMLSIDDALNLQEENKRLNYKLECMLNFQKNAADEVANLKMEIDKLNEQLSDSVRLEKIEELKSILSTL